MADSFKLDFLNKYSTILNNAYANKKEALNNLCNFLAYEFGIETLMLFEVRENKKLTLLANSLSADKEKFSNEIVLSEEQSITIDSGVFDLSDSINELIQSSENIGDEKSFLIECLEKKIIFKVIDADIAVKVIDEKFKKISDLIKTVLFNWYSNNSINVTPQPEKTEFAEIVKDTLLKLYSPLKIVADRSKVLSAEYLSTYQLNFVDEINTGAKYSLSTLEELTELSEYSNGTSKVRNEVVPVRDFLKELENKINFENAARNDSVRITVSNEVPKGLKIDKERLESVINSLIKITMNLSIEKKLLLDVSFNTGKMYFTFHSDGKGFKPFKDQLFQAPFDISNNEYYNEIKITPLSVKNFLNNINLLKGCLDINRSDTGKSFVTLNISGEQMSDSVPTKEDDVKGNTVRNNVLVIEDDFATAEMLKKYLTKWGYNPMVVNSSEDTLKAVNEHSFIVVILDIELPGTNGLELLKNIHANPKNKYTPVIVCSVEPENQKGLMIGSVDFFEKPINYGFLVEALAHYKLNKNSKILCVDDDLPTLSLIKKSIESAGFICIAENDSSKVLDLIKNEDLDLAIVDLDMPDPNGYELIKLIKLEDKFKSLPIIIFTGKDDYKEELKHVNGLFENLLEKKSTKFDELVEHINGVITKLESPPPVEQVVSKDDNEIKILLAEDYKHSQIIVTRLLKKNNFENIVVVENGQEAYDIAQKEKFDLILMDMQMPIMNGFEATTKIKELPDYSEVPVIALTAFAMKGDREKCLNAGATDYIPKPIDSKEFIKKVKQYTESEQ